VCPAKRSPASRSNEDADGRRHTDPAPLLQPYHFAKRSLKPESPRIAASPDGAKAKPDRDLTADEGAAKTGLDRL
jgi:hypothetical protein